MYFEGFKDLTRIEHTLFGLPFILSGALLSILLGPVSWGAAVWLVPAFLMARISGMAFNQLIDRHFDARNPRTKNRALPTKRVTPKEAKIVAWGSLFILVLICRQINSLCFLFSFLAAFLLFVYSYLKRINAICHFILGAIHFFGPVMASLALLGYFAWPPFFLGIAAFSLIAGNDIIYSIQDVDFDIENKLHSLPSRFGIAPSLRTSLLLHGVTFVALISVGFSASLPFFYYLILLFVGSIFAHFHSSIYKQYKKNGTVRGIESLFFFLNVSIAGTILVFILASVLWRVTS